MMKENTLLVVIRQAPQRAHWLSEALDAAMVGAAFGKTVSLLFMGEGVLALLPNQLQGPHTSTSLLPTPETLAMYDIQHLCVPAADLHALNMETEHLIGGVLPLNEEQLRACFADAAHVLNF
ncbi:sulfurtransferase TusC [Halomonas alkaliantarctica]|nr:sulfurtransferase TusC [Halomonas alkaliantarctica]